MQAIRNAVVSVTEAKVAGAEGVACIFIDGDGLVSTCRCVVDPLHRVGLARECGRAAISVCGGGNHANRLAYVALIRGDLQRGFSGACQCRPDVWVLFSAAAATFLPFVSNGHLSVRVNYRTQIGGEGATFQGIWDGILVFDDVGDELVDVAIVPTALPLLECAIDNGVVAAAVWLEVGVIVAVELTGYPVHIGVSDCNASVSELRAGFRASDPLPLTFNRCIGCAHPCP